MTARKAILLAALLAAAGRSRASAELVLQGIHWQVGRVEKGRVASWHDVRIIEDGPPGLDTRLRARLVLKNGGADPVEGILVRYSMTSRLSRIDGRAVDGVWAIPFLVDERRVPKVGPYKTMEVPLETGPALELYMRRLLRSGWWPDRVRLQVMLEPHQGGSSIQTVEDVLEVRR